MNGSGVQGFRGIRAQGLGFRILGFRGYSRGLAMKACLQILADFVHFRPAVGSCRMSYT